MADSDSDAGSDTGEGGFDPIRELDKLPEKERKKWEKRLKQWTIFIDFIFRHITIITYKYNAFEQDDLTQFMIALEKAETLRSEMKLKKKEDPRISSFKLMKDCSDLLRDQKYIAESNRIKSFLNIAGRMRGLSMIAGGFYKALKKGKIKGLDKVKYYLDYWKGFTARGYDYSQLTFANANPDTFNALEQKYLVWPTVVKTAINLAQKFMKKSSEATGLELINADLKLVQKYLEAPEFYLATKIESSLMSRVQQETRSFAASPLIPTQQQQLGLPSNGPNAKYGELPNVEDINPDLLKPIPENAVLMNLPEDPPKDKKGRKGKKGKGKKGGRSASASSHKGGKKKKRK